MMFTNFSAIPEFSNIVGATLVEELSSASDSAAEKAALQKCFTALMTSEKSKVETQLTSLVSRTQQAGIILHAHVSIV